MIDVYQAGNVPESNEFLIVKLKTPFSQIMMVLFEALGILLFCLFFYLRPFRTALIDILKCRKETQSKEKQINIAMEAFLCSQMNMELVCSILQSI